MLDAWRESPLYDERERRLELWEAVRRVADGHVPGQGLGGGEATFRLDKLAQLVFAIVVINAWNRLVDYRLDLTRALPARARKGSLNPQTR